MLVVFGMENRKARMRREPRHRAWWRSVALSVACVAMAVVVGGFAAPASANFGVESFEATTTNQDGTPSLQAGAHPYEMTVTFKFNTTTDSKGNMVPDGNMKNVEVGLPSGLIGEPSAVSECTLRDLDNGGCGGDTQVGQLTLYSPFGSLGPLPVYNMVPRPGVPAQLGTNIFLADSFVNISVRTGSDYGLTASLNNVLTLLPITGSSLTLWGVPADQSHDVNRVCPGFTTPCSAGASPRPFLTNPTACGGPITTTLRADSWQDPENYVTSTVVSHDSSGNPVGVDGCGRLSFNPAIEVEPEGARADSPTGLLVALRIPQGDNDPNGLATPAMKTASIALPEGVALSLSAADGLQGCTIDEFGLDDVNAPMCPNTSKIGSAEIDTPLLADPLKGSIFLAQPNSNPFGSLLALYVTVQGDGVLIKLAGEISADPTTGQLTTTFTHNPQLPFSALKFSFFGGSRSALATPPVCGTATTTSRLTSFGGQEVEPSSSFLVTASDGSGTCVQQPFTPALIAGSTSAMAGSFSPFMVSVSRADGQQNLSTIAAQLPRGLLANMAGVPLCEEPQASKGSCSEESQIGTVMVSGGAGSQPLYLPGSVYLTGPYRDAPFGLAIVVPAVAGPFDLGTIVVRAQIQVSESDLHMSIISGPLPQIIDGIPLRIRMVTLTIDRAGFMFTPTSCSQQSVKAVVESAQGADASISTPFQVRGCSMLPFAPRLAATTQAKGSIEGDGASLNVRVMNPSPSRVNIGSVSIELPSRLRPRLSTIQQACRAAAFVADPESCPSASLVGRVTVDTPVVKTRLTGGVYLVARGGTALPDLAMLPEGGGIKVKIDGTLNVSSDGVIATSFNALPDVPITSFELELPRGPHSMLGATKSLCGGKVSLRYAITAQNGARIKSTAKIRAKGCSIHINRRATHRRLRRRRR